MAIALYNCCGMGEDGDARHVGMPNWPPQHPPITEEENGLTFIRGYLKRLNSHKPGSDVEEKWVVRWIELERQAWQDRPNAPELLLSVYKSDAKLKRLNAVIFRRIKVRIVMRARAQAARSRARRACER